MSGMKFLSKKLKSKDCFFLCSKGREIKIVKFRRGWILCTSLFFFILFYSFPECKSTKFHSHTKNDLGSNFINYL